MRNTVVVVVKNYSQSKWACSFQLVSSAWSRSLARISARTCSSTTGASAPGLVQALIDRGDTEREDQFLSLGFPTRVTGNLQ
jgi:hypothetical protein